VERDLTADARSYRNEVAVLPLDGDLDVNSAPSVEWAIRRAEAERPDVLVLDLRRATFVDSTILREIVAARTRALAKGRRIAVAVASEAVRRVFRITLLEWRLEIVDDPADVRLVGGADGRTRHARRDHR
jgi:anti-anti-sigma factor